MKVEFAGKMISNLQWQYLQHRYERRTHGQKAPKVVEQTHAIMDTFKEFIGYQGRVLDVGCGNGRYCGKTYTKEDQWYVCHSNEITGLDPSWPQYESRFKVHRGIGEAMPFDDCVFDAVIMYSALDHVEYPAMVLQECRRVLVPEGKFFIMNAVFENGRQHSLHMWQWSESELKRLLSGFFTEEAVISDFEKCDYHILMWRGGKNGKA